MVSRVSPLDTETADKFLESLYFDDNGNLSGTLNIKDKACHDICLNYHLKPTRTKSKEVIIALQEKLTKLKETVEQNI